MGCKNCEYPPFYGVRKVWISSLETISGMGMGQWVYLYGEAVENFLSNFKIRWNKMSLAAGSTVYKVRII
jgi:hypothetical protein